MSRPNIQGVPTPPGLNLSTTLGALQIGVLVSTFLFGVVTVQAYVYSFRFPKDPWGIKLLVLFVWLLEFCHTVAICGALYEITIVQYAQPELMAVAPQGMNFAVLLSGFIGPLEQGWFAHRIHKFSKRLLLPLFCIVLTAVRFIGSIGLSYAVFQRHPIQDYEEHWSWLITSILVIGACNDVILAMALCYHLSKWKVEGFQRATKLNDSLMLWAIETGLVTSIGAVALLVCFLVMPTNFIWLGLFTILAKLFSNSLLASLNSRTGLARILREEVQIYDSRSH